MNINDLKSINKHSLRAGFMAATNKDGEFVQYIGEICHYDDQLGVLVVFDYPMYLRFRLKEICKAASEEGLKLGILPIGTRLQTARQFFPSKFPEKMNKAVISRHSL